MKSPLEATPTCALALGLALSLATSRAGAVGLPPSGAGAPVGPVVERPSLPLRSCAVDAPVCLHLGPGLAPDEARRARDAAASAWSRIVGVLRFPAPLADGPAGGDPRLDVYVAPTPGGVVVGRDALALLEDRDAAPAFVRIDPAVVRAGGCALDFHLARAIAQSSAAGLDVAETPVLVEGFARYAASIVAPCAEEDGPPFAALQATPWRSLFDDPSGTEELARTLDIHDGAGFGALIPGVLSMAAGAHGVVTPEPDDFEWGPAHFRNEPSAIDVLSATLRDSSRYLDDMWLDVAVARASEPTPGGAKPTLDWQIPVSSLPRRLAVSRGVEVTGASYLRIDVDRTPKGGAIELDPKWEQGARFRWAVLQLDAQGHRVGQIGVARLDRARELTIEVRKLDGVAAVLVVGVNTGDPARPWNPDDPPTSPHGFELGVYEGE